MYRDVSTSQPAPRQLKHCRNVNRDRMQPTGSQVIFIPNLGQARHNKGSPIMHTKQGYFAHFVPKHALNQRLMGG